jgi:hypothetical protein
MNGFCSGICIHPGKGRNNGIPGIAWRSAASSLSCPDNIPEADKRTSVVLGLRYPDMQLEASGFDSRARFPDDHRAFILMVVTVDIYLLEAQRGNGDCLGRVVTEPPGTLSTHPDDSLRPAGEI